MNMVDLHLHRVLCAVEMHNQISGQYHCTISLNNLAIQIDD